MERLTVTPEEQALIDAYKTEQGSTFDPQPAAGTNIIEGDHLLIDNSWAVIVIGGQWGCVACLVPEFGDLILPIDLVDYVTDRAGPNGETMPIYDPPAAEARTAAKTEAVAADTKQTHGRHRKSLADALRDAIKRMPHDQQKQARQTLRDRGILGGHEQDDNA